MPEILPPGSFLEHYRKNKLPLLDVRSEGEFHLAHIPGAQNLPLLNDDHRRQVGITYKSNGHEAAVIKGYDLVGGKFAGFIRSVNKLTSQKQLMLYCWRGGMRSSMMSWVLESAGYKPLLLQGGYKEYRQFVFQVLQQPRNVVVIGGKTGSGKTELLAALKAAGEQVICLETLASHRGSAFGGLGMPDSPRNEMFQNLLAHEWAAADPQRTLYLENESLTIGPIVLPPFIFQTIRNAPMIEINLDNGSRIKRIIEEYGKFPVEDLKANTTKLSKRLGGLRLKQALEALEQGNLEAWVEEVLHYYDSTYQFGNTMRKNHFVKIDAGNQRMEELAKQVVATANSFQTVA